MTTKRLRCACARRTRRSCVLSSVFLIAAARGFAQDPFEIHVLEIEELRPGDFTAEVHMNYVAKGAGIIDGTTPGPKGQIHLTYEVTGALRPEFSFGVMQLNERSAGRHLRSAGWRLVPHFYAPRSWGLPVRVGLTAEFSFEKTPRAASTRGIELLPIFEKQVGGWKVDVNPTIGKVLHGERPIRSWEFGLASRLSYERIRRLTPTVEYYSDWGGLALLPAITDQVHQIVPGGDLHLKGNIVWNAGIGVGMTSSGQADL
jgi:hypothetical protein